MRLTIYCYAHFIDVGAFLGSHLLPNNSIVAVEAIGEGLDALVCFTNRENCCSGVEAARWLLPDDTVVGGSGDGVYESRGLDILTLNRQTGTELDSGLYRCEIPDAEGVNRTLYVGVYTNGTSLGEGDYTQASLYPTP